MNKITLRSDLERTLEADEKAERSCKCEKLKTRQALGWGQERPQRLSIVPLNAFFLSISHEKLAPRPPQPLPLHRNSIRFITKIIMFLNRNIYLLSLVPVERSLHFRVELRETVFKESNASYQLMRDLVNVYIALLLIARAETQSLLMLRAWLK